LPLSTITWMDTAVTFPRVLCERRCITYGEMYVQALNDAPPYGCNYEVISGEWPPSLTLEKETGQIYGTIDDNSVSAPSKVNPVPEGFHYNESNYLNHHTSGVALEFVIRAYNPLNPALYADNAITMYVRTNWSAKRDQLVLNIQNQFYTDGVPVSNESYLKTQKERGNFHGPNCDCN